jgi:hypothetical protein
MYLHILLIYSFSLNNSSNNAASRRIILADIKVLNNKSILFKRFAVETLYFLKT